MTDPITFRVRDHAELAAKLAHHIHRVPSAFVVGGASRHTAFVASVVEHLGRRMPGAEIIAVESAVPMISQPQPRSPVRQLVAVGGGKVIDAAKIMSLGLSRTELADRLSRGETSVPRTARLVCIPTTAGSGSEATHFATCYLGQVKHSIAHPSILPDVVALCPEALSTLSDRNLAISGIDAVAQSIESMFSKNATLASAQWAEESLGRALPALRSMRDGSPDLDRRADLQIAAHLSGRAINVAKTNLPHALSYHLTAVHGVPHGLAVALFVEPYLQFLEAARKRMSALQLRRFECICQTICNAPDFRPGSWTALLRALSLPSALADLATPPDRLALQASVNAERLRNFAIPIDLQRFVTAAFAMEKQKFASKYPADSELPG